MLRQPNNMEPSCCHVATSFYYTDCFILGGEAVSKRKPRSERRGWETSFKQALLLRAEGGIRPFFVGHCRGDTASNVRNVAITRRHRTLFPLPLRLRTSHLLIVRGNREAVGARSRVIPRAFTLQPPHLRLLRPQFIDQSRQFLLPHNNIQR